MSQTGLGRGQRCALSWLPKLTYVGVSGQAGEMGFPIIDSSAPSASALQREFLRNGPVRLYEKHASVFLRQVVAWSKFEAWVG